MARQIHILGVSGSIREGSYNAASLAAASELLPADTTLETIGLIEIPMYNDDVLRRGMPASVQHFRARMAAADALLIATPEYNYSIPGVLKNALEWVSRPPDPPCNWKPCAILGATVSPLGSMRGQYHLRQVCSSLNIFPINAPAVDIADARNRFDEAGRLTHEPSRTAIRQLLAELRDFTLRFRHTG